MWCYLYSPRMPSSCAILLKAASVPLYGIDPALIPWVYKKEHIAVLTGFPYVNFYIYYAS